MRRGLLTLLALALSGPALAQDGATAIERGDLDRPETHVVLSCARLPELASYTAEQLRLVSLHDGKLRSVPFQVDERTPDGRYAYDQGAERISDTDDGRLDDNDELVFMARDAGDRALTGQLALGQAAQVELQLRDDGGGRAWAYLLAFGEPPPACPDDYVDLELVEGEPAGWSGWRGELSGQADGNLLALDTLRFRDEQGQLGPDVLDRAKLRFEASYLFTDLVRRMDEVRCGVLAWRDGPVRALVSLQPEAYLIWGHWIRPAPRPHACQLVLYGNRMELTLALQLPVDLEPDAPSSVRFSLDFAPGGGDGTRVWTDRNPERWRAGSNRRRRLRELDRGFPAWICATPPGGSLLARLELDPHLRGAGNRLFLEDGPAPDPPEDAPGSFANTGFLVDLQGLSAGSYTLRLTLQLGPTLKAGQEVQLLRAEAPLQVEVSAR